MAFGNFDGLHRGQDAAPFSNGLERPTEVVERPPLDSGGRNQAVEF